MAKDQATPLTPPSKSVAHQPQADELRALAEELFRRHWQSKAITMTPEGLASLCFAGAATFLRFADRVREGEIKGPNFEVPNLVPKNVSSTEDGSQKTEVRSQTDAVL